MDVARELLKKHYRVIFNGNGYDKSWPTQADARGIWRIDSGVEAMKRFNEPKNVELFSAHKARAELSPSPRAHHMSPIEPREKRRSSSVVHIPSYVIVV